jgi:hypothetical protein
MDSQSHLPGWRAELVVVLGVVPVYNHVFAYCDDVHCLRLIQRPRCLKALSKSHKYNSK